MWKLMTSNDPKYKKMKEFFKGFLWEFPETHSGYLIQRDKANSWTVEEKNRNEIKNIVKIQGQIMYIFDAKGAGSEKLEPLNANCPTLCIASSDEEHFKKFLPTRARDFKRLMPVWSKAELDECRRLCYPTESEEKEDEAKYAAAVAQLSLSAVAPAPFVKHHGPRYEEEVVEKTFELW
jgi:hypothetical protein